MNNFENINNQRFSVLKGWPILCKDLEISTQDLLRHARLPLDMFSQKNPTLTIEEYFRFWESLDILLADPVFPLRVGQNIPVEAFSPAIFACLCSLNLNGCGSLKVKINNEFMGGLENIDRY